MINDEADEVTKELFDSLKNKCQNNLESVKCSEFVFDYVYLLCHKINPNWIKHRISWLDEKQESNNKSN